uniref:Transposase n=1 Tax=Angiostrongylus cantonensis TaxID=6313 RepID=A0A0K0DRD4_ANGCA
MARPQPVDTDSSTPAGSEIKLDGRNRSDYEVLTARYRKTGSEKTFTMGTEERRTGMRSEDRGIIPRLVEAIFRQISEFVVDIKLKAHGLSKTAAENLDETMTQLEKGGINSSKGATAMDTRNCTSHAVFTISLEKIGTDDE